MKIRLFILVLLLVGGQISHAQKIDTVIYEHLLHSDKIEFTSYAQSVGLKTDFDSLSNTLFAKTKGILFSKPLGDKGNEYFVLEMIVSTLDKANNRLIIKDAKPVEGKQKTWSDTGYWYIEWDLENPVSKEMWYKVLVYRRK